MMSAKQSLGRGFDSLIPVDVDTSLFEDDRLRIESIPLKRLQPNPHQPRTVFDEKELAKLAISIQQHGILQPLLVTPAKQGYIIIAGERRWRAAHIAGITEVPAVVRSSKEIEQLELGLIENIQRVDLSPLDQALSLAKLHQHFNMPYETIAERIGKATTTVINIVRLLQLPPDAKQALSELSISEGHARAILSLKDHPKEQQRLLKEIIAKGWSVRQAEQFAVGVKQGQSADGKAVKRTKVENPATKRLAKQYGIPVSLQYMAKGGKVVFRFRSDEEYERLMLLLSGMR